MMETVQMIQIQGNQTISKFLHDITNIYKNPLSFSYIMVWYVILIVKYLHITII